MKFLFSQIRKQKILLNSPKNVAFFILPLQKAQL